MRRQAREWHLSLLPGSLARWRSGVCARVGSPFANSRAAGDPGSGAGDAGGVTEGEPFPELAGRRERGYCRGPSDRRRRGASDAWRRRVPRADPLSERRPVKPLGRARVQLRGHSPGLFEVEI